MSERNRIDLSSENWYKLDNVAKVFLATFNRRDTRSLRVGCIMSEKVDGDLLNQALLTTIKSRSQYQVRIRRGFFWHYLEATDALPEAKEEDDRPCPILYGPDYKGTLHYKVSFFGDRINLDLFHALSDGTGALEFLNLIILNYLKLKYPEEFKNVSVGNGASADDLEQDSFSKFYDNNGKFSVSGGNKNVKAYHLRGLKLPYDQLQFLELHMSAGAVLSQAKAMGVSLTSFLGAQIMLAIRKDMPAVKKRQPVTISVPVNLRNYYPSETARNFFNSIYVSHVFNGDETAETLAKEFDEKLKKALEPENVRQQMENYQKLETMFIIRMAPLLIKQPVVRFFSRREGKNVSAVLSNLGRLKPAEEMTRYIKGYSAFCSHDTLFFTVGSYGDDLMFGITSAYNNTGVLKSFVRSFTESGIETCLYSTEVVR